MKGGIRAWKGLVSKAEVEQGAFLFEGNEKPAELMALAYGIEEGTRRLYRKLSEEANEETTTRLFEKLAEMEGEHAGRLWEKYRALTGGRVTKESFESGAVVEAMEGGHAPERLLSGAGELLGDPYEAIQLAMSLETDAFDLYLRMAGASVVEGTKAIFLELADEEKGHLRTLGKLLEVNLGR
jgi:rubrerythrin